MLLVDVNILLAAHRDDHPNHASVRPWFEALIAGDEPFTVPTVVWGSFLRLATNRRIFTVPTPRVDALAFIDSICAQPHYLSTSPGPRHLILLKRVSAEGEATGDLVTMQYWVRSRLSMAAKWRPGTAISPGFRRCGTGW